MNIVELNELGWYFSHYWNNRSIFYFRDKNLPYLLFEHNGNFGLIDPFEKNDVKFIYKNLTDENIRSYTNLLKCKVEYMTHPHMYSIQDDTYITDKLKYFILSIKNA